MDSAQVTLYFESTASGGSGAQTYMRSGETSQALPFAGVGNSLSSHLNAAGTLPIPTSDDNRINSGRTFAAAGNLPIPTAVVSSLGGLTQAATLPTLQGAGTATIPIYLRGAARLPVPTGAASATLTGLFHSRPDAPLPTPLAGVARFGWQFGLQTLPGPPVGAARVTLITHLTTAVPATLPKPTGAASIQPMSTVLHGTGQILPMLKGPGSVHADAALPRPIGMGAITTGTVATRQAWAMNLATKAITQYTGFSYRAFARAFNQNYGIGLDSGFYLLQGDTDAGVAIDWEWRTGLSDLGTRAVKGVLGVYIDGVCEPGCTLTVATERGVYVYRHQPFGTINDHETQRVTVGKGLRTVNIGLGMASASGAYFDLDSMTPEWVISDRNM